MTSVTCQYRWQAVLPQISIAAKSEFAQVCNSLRAQQQDKKAFWNPEHLTLHSKKTTLNTSIYEDEFSGQALYQPCIQNLQ